jgi:hypothetical protein
MASDIGSGAPSSNQSSAQGPPFRELNLAQPHGVLGALDRLHVTK